MTVAAVVSRPDLLPYRRSLVVLAGLTLAMGTVTLAVFPGWSGETWVRVWCIWAVLTAITSCLALGRKLLKSLLPHLLPSAIACAVFTASVLTFGGTPLYLIFMWGIFFGLGLLASRSELPEAAGFHGWATLIASLLASMGSFFVTIDPTLLAVFLFAVIPLATLTGARTKSPSLLPQK